MLASIFGAVIWLVANLTYARLRATGKGGAGRFFGFWLGLPSTFVLMIMVREGHDWDATDDSLHDLIDDIRHDRALRAPEDGPHLVEGSEPVS